MRYLLIQTNFTVACPGRLLPAAKILGHPGVHSSNAQQARPLPGRGHQLRERPLLHPRVAGLHRRDQRVCPSASA